MLKKILWFLVTLLMLAMMLFLLVSLFKPDILLPIIEWIKSQIESLGRWNYLLAFVSALAESLPIIWAILPGQTIMISVWGFYGAIGWTQFLGVLLAAIGGSIISNAFWYFLGKYYGESFFEKYGMWIGIEKTELKYLKKWVETWGVWGIILSKFHPQGRAFLPFIAGSMWFSRWRFWLSNILASTLWAIFFITIGVFFAQYYEAIIKYMGYVFMWGILVVVWYFWFFRREAFLKYWQEKNAEIQAKYENK